MHKTDVLVLIFLLAFYSPAFVDSRKVQFDLKEVGTEHRANYHKKKDRFTDSGAFLSAGQIIECSKMAKNHKHQLLVLQIKAVQCQALLKKAMFPREVNFTA